MSFPTKRRIGPLERRNLVVRFGKERMGDLYIGLSILIGLSFIKVLMIFGETPLWLLILSGIPLLLIFGIFSGFGEEIIGMRKDLNFSVEIPF